MDNNVKGFYNDKVVMQFAIATARPVFANRRAREQLGLAEGELRGTMADIWADPADRDRLLAELQAKGVQASAEPVGGTPAQAWLDARLPAATDSAALARIAPSRALDCAALR